MNKNTKNTTLFDAIKNKNLDKVQEAINNGANVNARDDEWVTPLICAVYSDSVEIAKILLENHADINIRDQHGQNALFYIQNGNVKMMTLLAEYQDRAYNLRNKQLQTTTTDFILL